MPPLKAPDQISISIHAPAKGATGLCVGALVQSGISIHAPAKGATCTSCPTWRSCCNFNPRSREGSDLIGSFLHCTLQYFNPRSREGSDFSRHNSDTLTALISIHAPAKGATPSRVCLCRPKRFQSTLPRRERRFSFRYSLLRKYFNPRSREGSDELHADTGHKLDISIHAPAKGATSDIMMLA